LRISETGYGLHPSDAVYINSFPVRFELSPQIDSLANVVIKAGNRARNEEQHPNPMGHIISQSNMIV
jgi:hypothetical protein